MPATTLTSQKYKLINFSGSLTSSSPPLTTTNTPSLQRIWANGGSSKKSVGPTGRKTSFLTRLGSLSGTGEILTWIQLIVNLVRKRTSTYIINYSLTSSLLVRGRESAQKRRHHGLHASLRKSLPSGQRQT
jgi:hypothetical protein